MTAEKIAKSERPRSAQERLQHAKAVQARTQNDLTRKSNEREGLAKAERALHEQRRQLEMRMKETAAAQETADNELKALRALAAFTEADVKIAELEVAVEDAEKGVMNLRTSDRATVTQAEARKKAALKRLEAERKLQDYDALTRAAEAARALLDRVAEERSRLNESAALRGKLGKLRAEIERKSRDREAMEEKTKRALEDLNRLTKDAKQLESTLARKS